MSDRQEIQAEQTTASRHKAKTNHPLVQGVCSSYSCITPVKNSEHESYVTSWVGLLQKKITDTEKSLPETQFAM